MYLALFVALSIVIMMMVITDVLITARSPLPSEARSRIARIWLQFFHARLYGAFALLVALVPVKGGIPLMMLLMG